VNIRSGGAVLYHCHRKGANGVKKLWKRIQVAHNRLIAGPNPAGPT
jgi:hypothetical protein